MLYTDCNYFVKESKKLHLHPDFTAKNAPFPFFSGKAQKRNGPKSVPDVQPLTLPAVTPLMINLDRKMYTHSTDRNTRMA